MGNTLACLRAKIISTLQAMTTKRSKSATVISTAGEQGLYGPAKRKAAGYTRRLVIYLFKQFLSIPYVPASGIAPVSRQDQEKSGGTYWLMPDRIATLTEKGREPVAS